MTKQFVILAFLGLLCFNSFGQDASKYQEAMGKALKQVLDGKNSDDFQQAANSFDRIAQNEPKQWLPLYYKAYAQTMQAFTTKDKKSVDDILQPTLTQIEGLIDRVDLEKDPIQLSEVHTLIAMMYNAMISADVMTRGPKFGPLAFKHLEQAEALNPENPRVQLLKAQNLFYTPEAFGGDKQAAQEKVERALQLFEVESQSGEASLMPSWGFDQAQQLLDYIQKAK